MGDDEVLLGLSGGVDSSVTAALLHRAIGDRLTCVFVDNGLLRLNEGDQVMKTFAENMGVKVIALTQKMLFWALSLEKPSLKQNEKSSEGPLSRFLKKNQTSFLM